MIPALALPKNIPNLPTHIGIIMDGNGRWAEKLGFSRLIGHQKCIDKVRLVVRLCGEIGIPYLTLYAFSFENWNRPQDEVSNLLSLLRWHLVHELDELHKNGVCIKVIGERYKFPQDLIGIIENAEKKTEKNTKLTLFIAFSYSARQEMISGVKKILERIEKKELQIEDVNEDVFSKSLYTSDAPDPDLIIRTSGEQRLSNFLLWQASYSELYFCSENWPDFSREEFTKALDFYAMRDRRYGRV